MVPLNPQLYDMTAAMTALTGGDQKLASVAPNIVAALAANGNRGNTGNFTRILIDLGTHDMLTGSATLDATYHTAYVTNFQTVLDALHAAQPGANIYVHRDWMSTQPDLRIDTINGWTDEAIASRNTFTFPGPDQRTWFKPFVGTYSADGVHFYTAAGQAGCVAAWQAIPGF
jgi:hypothetical protein